MMNNQLAGDVGSGVEKLGQVSKLVHNAYTREAEKGVPGGSLVFFYWSIEALCTIDVVERAP